MIRTWEDGTDKPRERYLLLYRRIFPERQKDGADLPGADPEAVLQRARHIPAAPSSPPQLRRVPFRPDGRVAFADKLLALQRQVDDMKEQLERLLGEAGE